MIVVDREAALHTRDDQCAVARSEPVQQIPDRRLWCKKSISATGDREYRGGRAARCRTRSIPSSVLIGYRSSAGISVWSSPYRYPEH